MLNRTLSALENTVAVLAFMTITLIAFVNVVSRYFLNASLAFTTEITVNVAVWMTMLGAVIGLREGAHLGFSLLHEKAKGRAKAVMTVLIGTAIVLFFLIVLIYGWNQVGEQIANGRATPSMGIPQWLFSLALPVGALLGILRAVQVTCWSLQGIDPPGRASKQRVVA